MYPSLAFLSTNGKEVNLAKEGLKRTGIFEAPEAPLTPGTPGEVPFHDEPRPRGAAPNLSRGPGYFTIRRAPPLLSSAPAGIDLGKTGGGGNSGNLGENGDLPNEAAALLRSEPVSYGGRPRVPEGPLNRLPLRAGGRPRGGRGKSDGNDAEGIHGTDAGNDDPSRRSPARPAIVPLSSTRLSTGGGGPPPSDGGGGIKPAARRCGRGGLHLSALPTPLLLLESGGGGGEVHPQSTGAAPSPRESSRSIMEWSGGGVLRPTGALGGLFPPRPTHPASGPVATSTAVRRRAFLKHVEDPIGVVSPVIFPAEGSDRTPAGGGGAVGVSSAQPPPRSQERRAPAAASAAVSSPRFRALHFQRSTKPLSFALEGGEATTTTAFHPAPLLPSSPAEVGQPRKLHGSGGGGGMEFSMYGSSTKSLLAHPRRSLEDEDDADAAGGGGGGGRRNHSLGGRSPTGSHRGGMPPNPSHRAPAPPNGLPPGNGPRATLGHGGSHPKPTPQGASPGLSPNTGLCPSREGGANTGQGPHRSPRDTQGAASPDGGSPLRPATTAEVPPTLAPLPWTRPRGGGGGGGAGRPHFAASPGLLSTGIASSSPPSSSSGLLRGRAPAYDFRVVLSSGKTSVRPITLAVGLGCVQGARTTMEDDHFIALDRAEVRGRSVSLVGVLDGHCGRRVAAMAARWLPEFFFAHGALGDNNALAMVESILLADRAIYKRLRGEGGDEGEGSLHFVERDGAASRGREEKEEEGVEEEGIGGIDGCVPSGGSTLIAAAVHGRMLYVACLGDARAVLYDGHTTIAMSEDHKPANPKESRRIARCGGFVQFGRVCGILAVSRALGDFEFKMQRGSPRAPRITDREKNDVEKEKTNGNDDTAQPEYAVSNVADVRQLHLTDNSTFLILACDGLWDVLLNEEATQFVKDFLSYTPDISDPLIHAGRRPRPPPHVISRVLNNCCRKLAEFAVDRGSMDNVSVMLLFFHDVVDSVAEFNRGPGVVANGLGNGLSMNCSGSGRGKNLPRSSGGRKESRLRKPSIRHRRHPLPPDYEITKKKARQRGGAR